MKTFGLNILKGFRRSLGRPLTLGVFLDATHLHQKPFKKSRSEGK
jgi:hypothetical protein